MPAEKIAVKNAPNRCPFCHEEAERERSVACQDCLARHHEDCWTEGAGCSACSSQRQLAPSARPALTRKQATQLLIAEGYTPADIRALFVAPAERSRTIHSRLGPFAPFLYLVLSLAVVLACGVVLAGIEVMRTEDDRLLVAMLGVLGASVMATVMHRVGQRGSAASRD